MVSFFVTYKVDNLLIRVRHSIHLIKCLALLSVTWDVSFIYISSCLVRNHSRQLVPWSLPTLREWLWCVVHERKTAALFTFTFRTYFQDLLTKFQTVTLRKGQHTTKGTTFIFNISKIRNYCASRTAARIFV